MTTVAVLGLGSIGLRHATNLIQLGQHVVGFDPDPERRSKLLALGGTTSESREFALEQADAAVVATPNRFHLDDLTAAIDAGCPTFVEKPISHRSDGVAELLAEARTRNLSVFAALNLRYHPSVEFAKAALAEQRIGPIVWARLICSSYLPNWRPHQDYRKGHACDPETGGILFEDIHEVDLANHLLGPARVIAATARVTETLELTAEDCADLILRHPDGVISSIHMDFATPVPKRVTEIAGTKGVIRIDIIGRSYLETNADGEIVHERRFDSLIDDDYLVEMDAFLGSLDGGGDVRCDGGEALDVLAQVINARELAGLPV